MARARVRRHLAALGKVRHLLAPVERFRRRTVERVHVLGGVRVRVRDRDRVRVSCPQAYR